MHTQFQHCFVLSIIRLIEPGHSQTEGELTTAVSVNSSTSAGKKWAYMCRLRCFQTFRVATQREHCHLKANQRGKYLFIERIRTFPSRPTQVTGPLKHYCTPFIPQNHLKIDKNEVVRCNSEDYTHKVLLIRNNLKFSWAKDYEGVLSEVECMSERVR